MNNFFYFIFLTISLTLSAQNHINPERGLGGPWVIPSRLWDYHFIRKQGYSISYFPIYLGSYREKPIEDEFLQVLNDSLGKVRNAGLKVIIRTSYQSYGQPFDPKHTDTSLYWIDYHLHQLQQVFEKNKDVIFVVQAGFIGAWGEWHSSTSGLNNYESRRELLTKLLSTIPLDRMIQLRTPHFKKEYVQYDLQESEAFKATSVARIGHHNDCFLGSNSDFGTFQSPIEKWKEYTASDSRFTLVGGEACGQVLAPERLECSSALKEMEQFHYSFFYPSRLYQDTWKKGGCWEEIQNRLGYRFQLEKVSFSKLIHLGEILKVNASIYNSGFASTMNQRKVQVILYNDKSMQKFDVTNSDTRFWYAKTTQHIQLSQILSEKITAGKYLLAIALPDSAPALSENPLYSIKIEKIDFWDARKGVNVIGTVEVK